MEPQDYGPCPFGCNPTARPVDPKKRANPGMFVQLSRHIEAKHGGKRKAAV